jgi:hypothetical protein
MKVTRVNESRNRTVDLTRYITPQANPSPRMDFRIAVAPDTVPYMQDEAPPKALAVNYVTAPLERYNYRQRQWEVVKTETWGDITVEFIDEWWIDFTWLGVNHSEVKFS